MKVSIRFFTVLREITGKKEEQLVWPRNEKVTIELILKTLAQKYGKDFNDYVYDASTGNVKGFLQFFINGKSASALNELQTELKEGDVLAIVPPVGGG